MTDATDKTEDEAPYSYPDPAQTARLRTRLASRVAEAGGEGLLAAALRRLQEAEGISPAEMAARLQTDAAGIDRLGLCRLPRADRFAEDTAAIADYCSCAASALLPLLRRVDVLATFAEPVSAPSPVSNAANAPDGERPRAWLGGGALVAARDADEEEDPADE